MLMINNKQDEPKDKDSLTDSSEGTPQGASESREQALHHNRHRE